MSEKTSNLYHQIRAYVLRDIRLALAGSTSAGGLSTTVVEGHSHDDRYFTEAEADSRYLQAAGDTLTGNLAVSAGVTVDGVDISAHAADTGNPHGVTAAQLGVVIGTDVQAWDANLDQIAALTPTANYIMVGDGAQWITETGADARSTLGVTIGTDVQAWDANLDQIAALTPTANYIMVGDGAQWITETGADARSTLGVTIGTDVQAWDANLDQIAALTPTANYIMVGNGSQWITESGATARATLGVAIGTDVQAWDANLDQIAALTPTDGNVIVGDGAQWVAESGATARASLGLGTGDSPQFAAVNIGHATDTTLTRVSAGIAAIEGNTIALLTATQTLTNKTLTTPVIGDFSSATHGHTNAAGGGQLDHGSALTGLGDDDHTQYLLATGARTGASSQAQTFTNGVIDSTLTASRLMASDGSKKAVSVSNLASWIAETPNRVTVTDDGDGSVTLSGPQDIHTSASPTFAALYIDAVYDASGGNLTIAPTGDVVLDPTGNDILPGTNYDLNLGSLSKKYLTLHAAELWVETLVAQDTIATIGGRVLVGPTTTLTRDMGTGDTTIYVKHNEMASGDRAYMEANGKVEFFAVTSAATELTPNAEYSYTVTRNLDGTGANQWYAGDAIFNTGTTGDGWIDLYSVQGMKPGVTQAGPAIVGNVRNSSTYNDWGERWAIGNLNGVYGYGVDTYGAAFGEYASGKANVTIDATNGLRLRSHTTDILQIKNSDGLGYFVGPMYLDTAGGIYQGTGTFGSPTTGLKIWNDSGIGRIAGYSASTIQWYADTDGKLYAGAGDVKIDEGGITITPGVAGAGTPDKIKWGDWAWITAYTSSGYNMRTIVEGDGANSYYVGAWSNNNPATVTINAQDLTYGNQSSFVMQAGSANHEITVTTGTLDINATLTEMTGDLEIVDTTTRTNVRLGDNASGTYSVLEMRAGAGKYNWAIGAQFNENNALEITPSTATEGTTYSAPVFVAEQGGDVRLQSAAWYAAKNAAGAKQPLIRSRGAGYDASTYPGVQVGQEGDHIALFVDPGAVSGGSFAGNTNEIFIPNYMEFAQENSGGTDWTRYLLTLDDGKVGILRQPSYPLDVNGDVRLDGDVEIGGNLTGIWTSASLNTGWAASGSYATPGYKRFGDMVFLRGVPSQNTSTWSAYPVMFTLPVGYRPATAVLLLCACKTFPGPCWVTVETNGDVKWQSGGYGDGAISLDGVVFSVL
jgi:hypothetical protein